MKKINQFHYIAGSTAGARITGDGTITRYSVPIVNLSKITKNYVVNNFLEDKNYILFCIPCSEEKREKFIEHLSNRFDFIR